MALLLRTLVASIALVAAQTVSVAAGTNVSSATSAPTPLQLMTIGQAIQLAERAVGGAVMQAALIQRSGKSLYSVIVAGGKGPVDVLVDPISGRVREIK
ncbi:MAG: PepSY domain-containing protein [Rhodobacteraceae bacterium]|nr:PepSY domain-containing protein [Paracoccaceae bacterium]